MLTIIGPHCFICNGHSVVRRRVWGVTAWTEGGPAYGWVERDVCLNCEEGVESDKCKKIRTETRRKNRTF